MRAKLILRQIGGRAADCRINYCIDSLYITSIYPQMSSTFFFPFSTIGIVGTAAGSARDAKAPKIFPDGDMGEAQDLGGFVQAFGLLVGFDNARYMWSNYRVATIFSSVFAAVIAP